MSKESKQLAPSAQKALEAIKFNDGTKWLDIPVGQRGWTIAIHRQAIKELAKQFVHPEGIEGREGVLKHFDANGFAAALGSEQWLESSNFKQNKLTNLGIIVKSAIKAS